MNDTSQTPNKKPELCCVYPSSANTIQLKVGNFIYQFSQSQRECMERNTSWSFEDTRQALLAQWENLLQRIDIASNTPEKYKRMFYTGIYHTMLMPVDRTGVKSIME